MITIKPILIFLLFLPLLNQGNGITEVNFLKPLNIETNGLGPLMVKFDEIRGHLVLLNTNSSSLTLINGKDDSVINIPTGMRVPQYLKSESFTINEKNGSVYLIGNHSLTIVNPEEKQAVSFQTDEQYEMVAVDPSTGNCFLTGRESRRIAFFDKKKSSFKYMKFFNRTEKMSNLNQTPPPPVRKIAADPGLNTVFVFDGFSRVLYSLDMRSGRIKKRRELNIKEGSRFHFGGYDKGNHSMYLVTETTERKVIQALRIDCGGGNDQVIDLPGLSEGVGISYNNMRNELYIPYDNHPVVHIVSFSDEGSCEKVDIPAFGNDASAVDRKNNLLYVSSWAYADIFVIDLKQRKMTNRIRNTGILPHMFSIALNPADNKLYVPLGATAVNGSFGSAVTVFDTGNWNRKKISTGWAPLDLIEVESEDAFLVFNTENEFVKVKPDGKTEYHELPYPYPASIAKNREGNVFVSYGPHQSYWPVVYIWGAKNGIMEIEKQSYQIFDRRTPRLAHRIVFDKRGGLFGLQNSWGEENIFLTWFPEGIRLFAPQKKLPYDLKIQRENTPRLLEYDGASDRIYLVKTGERDRDEGTLLIINAENKMLLKEIKTGRTPTDMVFNDQYIYVSDFDSDSITRTDRDTFVTEQISTGRQPLKMALFKGKPYVINHKDRTVQEVEGKRSFFRIPGNSFPDNMEAIGDRLYISVHSTKEFFVYRFDPDTGVFKKVLNFGYPYGETAFDTGNSAFYLRGQFGDSIYSITQIKEGKGNRLWITDLLSGRLFIVQGFL